MQSQAPVVAPAAPLQGNEVLIRSGADAPAAVYRAFVAARQELKNQRDELQSQRRSIVNEMDRTAEGSRKNGLETQLVDVDKRIADVDKQIAAADTKVAQQAGIPGAVVPTPPYVRHGPPDEVYVLAGMAMFFVFAVTLVRQFRRRGPAAITKLPTELTDQLNRLSQSVDAIAVEVERIGEGQRFVTKVMADNGRGEKARIPLQDPGAR